MCSGKHTFSPSRKNGISKIIHWSKWFCFFHISWLPWLEVVWLRFCNLHLSRSSVCKTLAVPSKVVEEKQLRFIPCVSVQFLGIIFKGQRSVLDSWPLKMGPILCTETSVRNYHYTLCSIPEKRSYLPRGGSLKLHKVMEVHITDTL